MSNPHLSTRVERYGAPLASARVAVVLVHGRNHSPEYMDEHLVRPLALTDVAYVAPCADEHTWYPTSFLAPIAENQPRLDFTLERMAVLRDEILASGVPEDRIVWCGFSQGACVVSQFLWADPRRWGGLIALTGGLIGPPGTEWAIGGDFGGMPAYFSTSDADPFVPEGRVRESAARFAAAGAMVSVEFHLGRDHVISGTEVDRARCLLAGGGS